MMAQTTKWSIGLLGMVMSLLLGWSLGTAGRGGPAQASAAEVLARAQAEFEEQAANALEAEIVAVYGAASPSVVNVTSRSYVTYHSQIIISSGSSAGIGFAVSANTVRRVVPQLIANGDYAHPWLGVETMGLTPYAADILREAGVNVPVDEELLVLATRQVSPADVAGIQGASQWLHVGRHYQVPAGGDIITVIDGRATGDLQSLTVYLEMETEVGDTVKLTVLRDGQELTIHVVLEEQPQG